MPVRPSRQAALVDGNFETSLREDKQGIKRSEAIFEGKQVEEHRGFRKWLRASFGEALGAAARDDLRVFRGVMKTFNLMEKPGEFLKDNRIRWTVFRYMLRGRAKNTEARYQRGPDRLEMLDIIGNKSNTSAQNNEAA